MGIVAQAWIIAVERLGGDSDTAAATGTELEARYAEPHRSYHDAAHIRAVLRDSAQLARDTGLDGTDYAVVMLAACAHDVVYGADPGQDERASAVWAREQLTAAGVGIEHIDRVDLIVQATAGHHATDDDPAAAALLDADLAVLASSADDYASYVAAVRTEYAAATQEQWRTGRTAVLAALLDRTSLYATEAARTAWEADARRNVQAELETLATPPGTASADADPLTP
ncbi:MAG: hypothetical protein ABI345_03770 [Jatrophihabitans sp.]